MTDYVLMEGDLAMFLPTFGAATVVVRPGTLQGTGKTALTGKKICLEGDESKVAVQGCLYITPQYSVPGTGTLKISKLGGDQTSKKTKSGNKPVMLKGSSFTAKFEVLAPAIDPVSGAPDATPSYSGSGNFMSMNSKFTVS